LTERDEHRYEVWTARWQGGLAAEVEGRGHHLRADEPPEFGGGDTGPMPTELLAAALASCFCLAVAWAAKKRRLELPDLAVDVRPHRAGDEPRHGSYDITIRSSADEAGLARAVELAERFCWVTNTLRTPPEIRYHVEGGIR
jgi:putative redox protein